MQAVILAGGLGSRLTPFTKVIPKPMLPVGDRSILEIQIDRLKTAGVTEIFFAANYKSDFLQSYFGDGSKFGVRLKYSIESKKLGTCGPLSLLREKIIQPFIVLNGDILTNLDFARAYQHHCSHKGVLTIISKDVTFPLSYGNLVVEDGHVVQLQEKPDIRLEISAGIYIMSPDIFQYIPYNEHFGMEQLAQKLLDMDIPVHCYKMSEYWLDIGRMEDYQKAQTEYEKHFQTELTQHETIL